ncbi:MAG: ribonuclease Z [Deltaproteobacteria bacterium]|nr:ribonuclease Z [Deltaproteobacteria bacterium]
MRPSFLPRLVNGPFEDPVLFIPFLFEKRAVLFDLGDIHNLSAKDILKINHVFITHTHMDHFVGFDRLLRLLLGREKRLCLYGPEGFLKNIEGKLEGYSWNLVENYANRFTIQAFEVHPEFLISRTYLCQNNFRSTTATTSAHFDGMLLEEPALTVSAVILDHGIPCLGFSIAERFHVNIMRDRVCELGLDIGPWLREFKQALYNDADPASSFEVKSEEAHSSGRRFVLKDLADRIARITPGQKVTYIADVAYSRSNPEKIVAFARDSDHLFIEAAFLEKHRDIAAEKGHLTAWQAGTLAAKASVKQLTPFHFSPRYTGEAHLLYQEAMDAYRAQLTDT